MIELHVYIMQGKSDREIIKCGVPAYNRHPDFRPDFRRKKNAYYTRKITELLNAGTSFINTLFWY